MTELASLPDVARRSAERFADHVALCRTGRRGQGLTFRAVAQHVETGAANLRAAGLAPGDRVVFLAQPEPRWTPALLAILEARLVAVPLAAGTDPARVARAAEFVGAKAIVHDAAVPFRGLANVTPSALFAPASTSSAARPARDDLALVVFTSGSTSNPRAVELTHGNLLANLESVMRVRDAAPGDSFLSMLPPSHLFELAGGSLGPLAVGACVVYPGPLLPNRLMAALRDERITHALAVPALVDALYREVRAALEAAGVVDPEPEGARAEQSAKYLRDAPPERRDAVRAAVREAIGPTFHTMIVGGAALRPEWVDMMHAVGVTLDVGYGLTEASPIVSMGNAHECPAGSVGRPLPGVEVRIGEGGEILVRGANVMRGYFRDETATRDALEGGWLRTGDAGRLDERGFLFVEGRLKEAVVTAAGETVYPDEMEPAFASPLFAEWAVCPVRGHDGNDVATLVILPADPTTADDALAREFARLRAAAPPRLRPSRWHRARTPLPRTATGKLRRRALGETLPLEATR